MHDKAYHNYDIHKAYKEKYEESMKWINAYNDKMKKFGKAETTKGGLEKQLEEIQVS